MNNILFNIENGDSFSLSKRALVFVEGVHKDSAGRTHEFGIDRIRRYVENTNTFLRKGGRVPFQMDHKKTQDFTIGDVSGELYIKTIEPSDLPNPAYKHLVGKAGVFVDNIIGKGKEVVEQIKNGLIKTLSPGLDPKEEVFIEISATPTPAIIGPALFSKGESELITFEEYPGPPGTKRVETDSMAKPTASSLGSEKAFSFEDLEMKKKGQKDLYEKYEELSDDLFAILSSISSATEEELSASNINPVEASYNAIEYFLSNLEDMFGLVETQEEKEIKNKYINQGSVKFPLGNSARDYNRLSKTIDFSKQKTIGYIIK